MDEKPLDSLNETVETPTETAENINLDTSTDLPPKLMKRRKLSQAALKIGLTLGVLAIIFGFLSLSCHAPHNGAWCMGTDIPLELLSIACVIVLFLSTVGLVTSSRSYLNDQKRSIIGIVLGLVLVSASLMLLHFIAYNSAYHGVLGILENTHWIIIGFVLLAVGLNFALKAYRLKNRSTITVLSLLAAVIVFVLYTLVVIPLFKHTLYPGM